jgi:hypothetical protein
MLDLKVLPSDFVSEKIEEDKDRLYSPELNIGRVLGITRRFQDQWNAQQNSKTMKRKVGNTPKL